jgi:ketosteroid isomerase-like protein
VSEENVEISYEIRVKPGRTGTDPNQPDWEVCELEDGQIADSADIYDNLTLAEAHQIAGMWQKKKDDAEAAT